MTYGLDPLAIDPVDYSSPEMGSLTIAQWRARRAEKKVAGRRVIASISGGKDSAAMSLYLTELGIEHERVFMDTGFEHPSLYDFLRGPLTDKIGPITEIRGELDFFGLVRKKGLFPSRVMRFCTTELKVFPIMNYIVHAQDQGGDVINCVGIRRAESKARSEMAEWEWSDSFDCEVWRPLVRWSKDDVLAIHTRHDLPLNPLYALGATRVGCWPCIHARKSEIAIVAAVDPERIAMIDAVETELNVLGAARDKEMGREYVQRSMFSYHGGDDVHVPLSISQAVDWARSKRGEFQPPGAGDACMRYGVCSTDEED